MANEPTIDVMNEAICLFMGFEKVRIGYFGCKDGDPVYDETDWQVANEKWLEKMGIEDIGYYAVNVKSNEWYQWHNVEYHTSWDSLKPVIDEISKYVLAYPDQVKPIIAMSIVVDIKPAHEKVLSNITPINMSKKKLTPEGELMYRIIEQWGNVVAMPQMEGWIKEYGDSRVKAQPSPVWVKASVFDIKHNVAYHAMYEDINQTIKGSGFFNINDWFIWDNKEVEERYKDDWDKLLILDESGTAAGREEDAVSKKVIDRIKDFNLSDVDKPMFTHTKEFEAHFSYIKGKLMDLIRKYETKQQKEK